MLAGLLLAGEGAVRLFTDTREPLLGVDAEIGQRFQRGFDGTAYDLEAGARIPVRTNSAGFRFAELPRAKPPGHRRIALVGDSMIAALQLPEAQTAAALLQAELQHDAAPGTTWEVLNFGIPGAGTLQELATLRAEVLAYEPDHVLCLFFVGNDFGDNSQRLTHRRRLYYELGEGDSLVRLPYPTAFEHLTGWLDRHSRLYVWQKTESAVLAGDSQLSDELVGLDERHAWHGEALRASEYVYVTGPDEVCNEAWELTRRAVLAMTREVRARGATFTLAHLPCSQQVHREEWDHVESVAGEYAGRLDVDLPRRRLAEIADETGARYLDLLPAFLAAAPARSELARDEWLFFHGRGHLNVAGNVVLADALLEYVRTLPASAE
ncbi:MAG: SGNH/GDSL hydrolase family protein [Planctomycetes bacterium]|nr:SGNH/GDSL hydrolase family protein [Planctomycetota bacterium]